MIPALLLLPLLAYFILLLHMRWQWNADFALKEKPDAPVSLIIAYRNEENNLPNLLAALEEQDFPREKMEIVFVDDHSTDDGAALLAAYSGLLPILLLRSTGEGKEAALLCGIRSARYSCLAFTDADCLPTAGFLSAISSAFAAGADWVGGLVAVQNPKKASAVFDAYDQSALMAISAASYAFHRPALASGAFMAFPRNKLNIPELPTSARLAGSDVRLLKAISGQITRPVFIRKKNALVFTKGAQSWKTLFNQRKRWAGTAFRIRDPYILSLIIFGSYAQLYQLLGFVALFTPVPDISLLLYGPILVKLTLEALVVHAPLHQSGTDRHFLWRFPLVALLYPIYIFSAAFLGIFTCSNWKNRKAA